MKRLLAVQALALALSAGAAHAAAPQVVGFTVSASSRATQVSLPSSETPNAPGEISVPPGYETHAGNPQQLSLDQLQLLWQRAGLAYGVPWQVLAAINKIESNFGQNMGPSSAGAVGWMQFMPSTWLRWGVDADGDGIADPWTATDAVYAAARYLAAAGGRTDISRAVFAYNHADWYVREVLSLANVYGQGGAEETANLEQLQHALDAARNDVVGANESVVRALVKEQTMARALKRLQARAAATKLLSARLSAERRAVLYGLRVDAARAATQRAQSALADAQRVLASAEQDAQAPAFSEGAGSLLGAPAYASGYVFPVGGGPSTVSVSHSHHDYPAADIAAPEGAPVYALADAVVDRAWHVPDPRCGIGMTVRTGDGLVWTYCHLSYLDPAVESGSRLSAGMQVGLVGHTGHATGPHLHLQLHPATAWPQEMAWFQGFAGRAFRWQDAPTPLEAAPEARVFTVVPQRASGPVVTFTS